MSACIIRRSGRKYEEWEIPREAEDSWDSAIQDLFHRLQSQLARADQKPGELVALLAAINQKLKRSYTLETLPERL